MRELVCFAFFSLLVPSAFGEEFAPFETIERDPIIELKRKVVLPSVLPCASWIAALDAMPRGSRIGDPLAAETQKTLDQIWSPWLKADLEYQRECESTPCSVKLQNSEAAQLKAEPVEKRHDKFLSLVLARAYRYEKTGNPEAYEFASVPKNPFPTPPPGKPELSARILDLHGGRNVPLIRQILERRFVSTANSARFSMRAIYTDHFFEGWGETTILSCDEKSKSVEVSQHINVEFDLLKKKDIISLIAHGRMRSGVEEQAEKYLNAQLSFLTGTAGR